MKVMRQKLNIIINSISLYAHYKMHQRTVTHKCTLLKYKWGTKPVWRQAYNPLPTLQLNPTFLFIFIPLLLISIIIISTSSPYIIRLYLTTVTVNRVEFSRNWSKQHEEKTTTTCNTQTWNSNATKHCLRLQAYRPEQHQLPSLTEMKAYYE